METYGLEKLGILNPSAVYRNLGPAQLTEAALRRGEGKLSNTGALVVTTGKYTGRSPDDKFIVDTPAIHNDIAWGKVNRPIAKARFDAILAKVCAYLLSEAEQQGSMTFTIPFSRIQLADYLNCDRSALSRELSLMQRDGLLDTYKSSFKLLEPEALRQMIL